MILGMTLVTFGVRYSTLAFVGRMPLPPFVMRALRFVPVAVLTAICTPLVLMPEGQIDLSLGNAALAAAVLSIVVSWRTRSLLLTILIGMAVYLLWRAQTAP